MPRQLICGFALLELLLTIVLITVGVLGTLQIHLAGTSLERDLLYRIQANLLVGDIARKIDTANNNATRFLTGFGSPPTTINCWQVQCTDTQRHRFYLAHWKCRLGQWQDTPTCHTQLHSAALLPDGDGQITLHNGAMQIVVRWQDSQLRTQMMTHQHVLFGS